PWRRSIASFNYFLSSHVWRQDHNGFSHQDPGFLDHVINKKAEVIRVYLPPDANCLLSVTDHCLRSRNYVNVVVAGKQPAPQWLGMAEAIKHCEAGLGIWEWASNDRGGEPDLVMACCGEVPTLETLAAVDLLRRHPPELNVRAERHRPLPPGAGRDRPGAQARRARRLREAGGPRQAHGAQAVHRPVRRRHARDHGLEVGAGGEGRGSALHRGRQRLKVWNGA